MYILVVDAVWIMSCVYLSVYNNSNSHDTVYVAVVIALPLIRSSLGLSDEYSMSAGQPPTFGPICSAGATDVRKLEAIFTIIVYYCSTKMLMYILPSRGG